MTNKKFYPRGSHSLLKYSKHNNLGNLTLTQRKIIESEVKGTKGKIE